MTESELCQQFRDMIEKVSGWDVFPETSGWDLLLVGPGGVQVGIQAKLRASIVVLSQTIHGERWPGSRLSGPDYRMILVPKCSAEFEDVARELHIQVLEFETFNEDIASFELQHLSDYTNGTWYCWEHKKQCWTPPITVNVPAGVPSPRSVTPWKINAVKLCMRLRDNGYITSRDFQEFNIAFTEFWRHKLRTIGKMRVVATRGKRRYVMIHRYVQLSHTSLPDQDNPEIVLGLRALKLAKAAA